MNPVTVEITLSPVDVRHAVHVLPHQLRQWAGQVDDVQLTVNLRRNTGRYEGSDHHVVALRSLLADVSRTYPNVRVAEVDYSLAATEEVSERFFGGRPLPVNNHDGGPLYSYFWAWHAARNDVVFHMDSDMLFGGGSQTWITEAVKELDQRPDVLCAAPLPGPPTADGSLPDHIIPKHSPGGRTPQRVPEDPAGYLFHGCSTRVIMFNREQLVSRLGPLPLERPRLRSQLRARLEGHPPVELPEKTITRLMNRSGLRRFDFLGDAPGMWSLHPPLRSEIFYQELGQLVERVEAGDMPEGQLGDFDVNDTLIDWSTARQALQRRAGWRRVARRALSPLHR